MLVMLAVACGMVVGIDAWTRRLVEDQLADRLAESPDRAAEELARLAQRTALIPSDGSLGQLTRAAVDADDNVALAAQRRIDELLRSWQYARPRLSTAELHMKLATLAVALRGSAPGSDPAWSTDIVRRLLQVAADSEVSPSTGFINDCDTVLAAAATARPRPVQVADASNRDSFQAPSVGLRSQLAEVSESLPPSDPTAGDASLKIKLDDQTAPSELAASSTPPQAIESFLPPEPQAIAASRPNGWRPDWERPEPPPADVRTVTPPHMVKTPGITPNPAESLDALTDRELLKRFLPVATQAAQSPAAQGPAGRRRERVADASEGTPESQLRTAVVARGYGDFSVHHVRMLFSPEAEERRALVNLLLTSRSGDAARLLMLLAADESPQVRHDALMALGSSSDQRLVDTAWRMALEDRDPRVARLAGELRQR